MIKKVLFVTPVNSLADGLADDFEKFRDKNRVYSAPLELKGGLGHPGRPERRGDGSSEIDHFITNYVLNEAVKRHDSRPHARSNFKNKSLCVDVFERYKQNPAQYPDLELVIKAVKMKLLVTPEQMRSDPPGTA
ncbi:hypothetical protein F4679DRAFT_88635 [Xylaria curta]|nr:hypothetical protein F4679DRAFT_88635 [Xylaria curta]